MNKEVSEPKHGCPERARIIKERDRYRKALEDIREHINIVMGGDNKFSIAWNIANNALNQSNGGYHAKREEKA